ncbi:uncharacterized protein BDZ99DRAFT_559618 [Mytilinidion resinicola]|uniref:Oxidoreductase AflY n=1 Tax=Mytilinidion resinicola TaxID=574789 RepID=A0A6A6YUC4_9PEZI|nr:uncharacterized protein BDZ99DRAFT_559618 [Mytilinidion resinicola]KAF2811537.1 hypothetical protein BDZ99DRAFT_559618 [Mytilinidion resinicola]
MGLENTTTFHFDPVANPGLTHAATITKASSQELEGLLEENFNINHIFTSTEDERGMYFHNHIAHHLVTIWALGAKPATLRSQYERNATYQRAPVEMQQTMVTDLVDPIVFKRCLGHELNFASFTRFFINEIDKLGYQKVLHKYLVDGTEISNDVLCRIYMGYVHGIIHINLALEFRQAKMLAEGLAQACVHHDWWYTEYLTEAETLAAKREQPSLPLSDLIDMCRADDAVRTSSSPSYHSQTRPVSGQFAMDMEPARDGVLKNAKPELLKIAARFRVDPNDIERACAEVQNTAVYLTAGAQRPPYICLFDFSLLHTVTSSIGLSVFLSEPSLLNEQKARLLEYTGRIYLLTYACHGSPEIRLDWLASHPSKLKNQGWPEVFERAAYHEDDGHMSKLIRGIAHAQKTSKPYDHLPEFRIKQSLFLTAAIAAIDSGSDRPMDVVTHFDFIRGAGFPEPWERFPYRKSVRAHL